MQHGTPIENNLLALIITNQTQRVIDKIDKDPDQSILDDSTNFKGDTLLHYACAKNNQKLVEYMLKRCSRLATVRNEKGELP